MPQPAYDQDSSRGRDDDVVLNSAAFTHALNTNWTQMAYVQFRVRFLIQETGGGAAADQTFSLYYSHNGGSYARVELGSILISAVSLQYEQDDTTTQVLGSGTYIAGDSQGGMEGEGEEITGLIDVEASKEFDLEFCVQIDGRLCAEGDTIAMRVRRDTGTAFANYTQTPTITVTLPPDPDVIGTLGKVVFTQESYADLYGAGGWTAINEYFQMGNINTHPSSIPPYLVRLIGNSFRMKATGVIGPGLFPPGEDDTARRVITGLAAGRYTYEYFQVEHDAGVRTTRLLSGASETEVLFIDGTEADESTLWFGPFVHPFIHLGGDLVIEIYHETVEVPTPATTGIKDTGMRIREFVGLIFGFEGHATVTPPPSPTIHIGTTIRGLIGDRFGRAIAEIIPEWGPISWRLNDVGLAPFALSAGDEKATELVLQYGNRVYLDFDNGLPPWGGVIDPTRGWTEDGKIAVSSFSGEYMLGWRRTPRTRAFVGMTAGEIFQALILEANELDDLGISLGNIWTGGEAYTLELHYADVLQVIRGELCGKLTTAEFAILPVLEHGRISFRAEFYERRGSDKPNVVLLEGKNLSGESLVEHGPIVNDWALAGAGSGWGEDRLTSEGGTSNVDTDSIGKYGLRQDAAVFGDIKIQSTLDAQAATLLAASKNPVKLASGYASNLAPALFADYDLGDRIRVILYSKGFGGTDTTHRVTTREFDPASGLCGLVPKAEAD